MFRALGDRVMYGRNGRGDRGGQVDGVDRILRQYMPVNYPVPPSYPSAPMAHAAPGVNPAIRAAEVKEHKEEKEHKEAAEASGRRKWHGARSSYIPEWREFLTKGEMEKRLGQIDRSESRDLLGAELEDVKKDQAIRRFGITRQYNLSKHEPKPISYSPGEFGDRFGGAGGEASEFYRRWQSMSPERQAAEMATYNASINSPERLALTAARRQQGESAAAATARQSQGSQHFEQARQSIIRQQGESTAAARAEAQEAQRRAEQARQAEEQWANTPPAERQQIIYNRQLAEYNEAVEINRNLDIFHHQQQNQQANGGQQMGSPMMSPVMLDNLASMAQNENTRYVPVRPRASISNMIMRSFDPNMFSPEFIPEEENGY